MKLPYQAFRIIPDFAIRGLYYRHKYGRWPNIKKPELFSERIQHRMLNDRSRAIAVTCDKLACKDLVESILPDLRQAKVLWSGASVDDIPLQTFPDRWVLKPNHSSQSVFFGDSEVDLDVLRKHTHGWIKPYGRIYLGEWAYSQADRLLIVEEYLGSGAPPADYKLFVFGGRVKFVQVDTERFTGHRRRFYSTSWEPMAISNVFPDAEEVNRPEQLEDMIYVAEVLAEGYEFLRVDLYVVDGEIWFGELTPYPGGGMEPFKPHNFDALMGDWWESARG